MIHRYALQQINIHPALAVILLLAAVAGWGTFIASSRSSAEFEEHLRNQVSALHQKQMELLDERARTQAATGTLEQLQAQIAELRKERERLMKDRDLIKAEVAAMRSEQGAAVGGSGTESTEVSDTGSTENRSWDSQQRAVAAAQNALARMGYGPLQADGVMGPKTRQAIQRFQQDSGLTVTSELDLQTVRRLMNSSKVASQE